MRQAADFLFRFFVSAQKVVGDFHVLRLIQFF